MSDSGEERDHQPMARQTSSAPSPPPSPSPSASPLPGVSSASTSTSTAPGGQATPEMKRSTVRTLIQRYFHQLQSGCGNEQCTNINCASSGRVAPMTPNEVAARALQLFSQDARLCVNPAQLQPPPQAELEPQPERVAPVAISSSSSSSSSSSNSSTSTITSASTTTTTSAQSQSSPGPTSVSVPGPSPSPIATALPRMEQPELVAPAPAPEPAPAPASSTSTSSSSGECTTENLSEVKSLEASCLISLYEECVKTDSYDKLYQAVGDVFSCVERLSRSFVRTPDTEEEETPAASVPIFLAKPPEPLNKEQLRTLEGEHDKDEDSTQQAGAMEAVAGTDTEAEAVSDVDGDNDDDAGPEDADDEDVPMEPAPKSTSNAQLKDLSLSSDTLVDFEGLRRVQQLLFASKSRTVIDKLTSSVIQLADWIHYMRRYTPDWEKVIHCLVICFDLATNTKNMDYLDRVLPKLCLAASSMSVKAQVRLARIWAAHCADQLHTLVSSCQQQITLQVLLDEEAMRENEHIICVTKVLKIVFYANILASELERPSCRMSLEEQAEIEEDSTEDGVPPEEDLFLYNQVGHPHVPKFAEDQMENMLKVSAIDCRNPLVPLEEFYNEALSENIQMHHDYLSYKSLVMESEVGSSSSNYFSFMLYAFILTPATKVDALYYDSRMRMYSERYSTLYSLINNFGQDGPDAIHRPDLKLTVRRDQLINDALVGLELVAMSNPKDLKKQLVVEFVGEQGIDEGGVSKEFFQLIVEEIFNPAFGMFLQQEETNNMWFNATPFENGAQFTLIGIIIGLAIYNNVILAVNFPMVVYRKLLGYRGTFCDLRDYSPMLYSSLKSLLDFEGENMEDVFDQTFKISYSNVFGEMVEHELVPHGDVVLVGQHNKQLFVDLYADFLLNKNIQQQFNSFRKGFEMVTDESPLKLLFRPEEIEMLVCGSREFDFVELEHSTEYEGGYSYETPIIKDFWKIVHAMPHESKRKLLEFATGSARVPVGGLKCLRLLITRHGPDSDRLPTSHTCFNVLLLPEYSSKVKLEERLLKAINYSKGFGML
ncbi:ubiquitin-protein ligase E3A isoform X2 [Drosophila pseudoobscura]|uniref:HECT-type E3 ubiquitin transferase n=1 Tax=Drosophila pseudoobscura pseudoobscura TaxID=46245 RepID=A0A6I8VKL6_DROPS|nr:ubiquitin-protein ligase E3A isoform X2 [Drosophila pseudoobscura]